MEENLNTNLVVNEVEGNLTEVVEQLPNFKKGIITGLVIGGTALLGTIIYKKVVKPKLEVEEIQEDEVEEIIEVVDEEDQ